MEQPESPTSERQQVDGHANGDILPGQKREALLNQLNTAKIQPFHLRVWFFAGAGFFTDAYDLFAINIVTVMLGCVYGSQHSASEPAARLTDVQELGLKIASPVGTLFGQVVFGFLADLRGRKWMYGVELSIIILSTLVQACTGQGPFLDIVGMLIVWRFIMGVGIGGDYPVSAIISSEFAPIKTRGRFMTAVFSAQGWGQLFAALISSAIVTGLKDKIINDPSTDPRHVDMCWRLIVGLGCVPATLALYFRFTVPETPRFTMDIERNIEQATQDVGGFLPPDHVVVDHERVIQSVTPPSATLCDFVEYFSHWENSKVLVGTAYSWFALDVIFYGLGLNNEAIVKDIMFPRGQLVGSPGIFQQLSDISMGNMIFSAAGLIPGYYATFFTIDRWGRKPIQYGGFAVLTVIFAIMGFGYHKILNHSHIALLFLYCLANFFLNFGPNTTTFVVPGEAFPTRYRSTAYGLSAAAGKIGAIVTQVIIWRERRNRQNDLYNFDAILKIFSLFTLSGILSTTFLPETSRRSLEDISNEVPETIVLGVSHATPTVEPAELEPAEPEPVEQGDIPLETMGVPVE